jgi:hypothetical protein
MRHSLFASVFLAVAAPAFGDTVDLGGHGTLHLTLPANWRLESKPAEQVGMGIALNPTGETHAKCLITLAYLPNPKAIDRAALAAQLKTVCAPLVDPSVEKKVVVEDLPLAQGAGVLAAFTDEALAGKPPQTDDYKVQASALVQLNPNTLMVVNLFFDDKAAPEFKEMLGILASMTIGAK